MLASHSGEAGPRVAPYLPGQGKVSDCGVPQSTAASNGWPLGPGNDDNADDNDGNTPALERQELQRLRDANYLFGASAPAYGSEG